MMRAKADPKVFFITQPYSQRALGHRAATTMLESGVPIHIVSRILGHSKISITVDIYGHVSDEGAANAMQLLNKKLNSQ